MQKFQKHEHQKPGLHVSYNHNNLDHKNANNQDQDNSSKGVDFKQHKITTDAKTYT